MNEAYIRATLTADVAWYAERLADDFVCVSHDARVLNKQRFLEMIAEGSEQVSYDLGDVDVRVYGDVALIRAIGSWRTRAGRSGTSHYTDVYVRAGDDWKVVSAQITRPPVA